MTDESKDDGGPAFPQADPGLTYYGEPGMTLRDWFAGKAMAPMVGRMMERCSPTEAMEGLVDLAGAAYEFADAMLKARQ